MIYAQIKTGEEVRGEIVRAGYLGRPICGQPMEGNYRLTINLPLGHACKKCRAVASRLQ